MDCVRGEKKGRKNRTNVRSLGEGEVKYGVGARGASNMTVNVITVKLGRQGMG